MRWWVFILSLILSSPIFSGFAAGQACCIGVDAEHRSHYPTVIREFNASDVVFRGTILEIEDFPRSTRNGESIPPYQIIKFQTQRIWKGRIGPEATIFYSREFFSMGWEKNGDYLVYANYKGERLQAEYCSRTNTFEKAHAQPEEFVISPSELNRIPKSFTGLEVTVKGTLSVLGDSQNLYIEENSQRESKIDSLEARIIFREDWEKQTPKHFVEMIGSMRKSSGIRMSRKNPGIMIFDFETADCILEGTLKPNPDYQAKRSEKKMPGTGGATFDAEGPAPPPFLFEIHGIKELTRQIPKYPRLSQLAPFPLLPQISFFSRNVPNHR